MDNVITWNYTKPASAFIWHPSVWLKLGKICFKLGIIKVLRQHNSSLQTFASRLEMTKPKTKCPPKKGPLVCVCLSWCVFVCTLQLVVLIKTQWVNTEAKMCMKCVVCIERRLHYTSLSPPPRSTKWENKMLNCIFLESASGVTCLNLQDEKYITQPSLTKNHSRQCVCNIFFHLRSWRRGRVPILKYYFLVVAVLRLGVYHVMSHRYC